MADALSLSAVAQHDVILIYGFSSWVLSSTVPQMFNRITGDTETDSVSAL